VKSFVSLGWFLLSEQYCETLQSITDNLELVQEGQLYSINILENKDLCQKSNFQLAKKLAKREKTA
jgi:hypothetical protein